MNGCRGNRVKRDGIDYIALYYVNEKGKPVQILDAEIGMSFVLAQEVELQCP